MKKFSIHLDALLVLMLIAIALVAFVVYQQRQQQRLFQQTIDLTWELQNTQVQAKRLQHRLDACRKDRGTTHQQP